MSGSWPIMVSGGSSGGSGGAGNRRKASAGVAAPAKREPRRGLGVAELERIRVELEMAEGCYVVPSLSAPPAVPLPPPPPPLPTLVAHHPYQAGNGNGAVQIEYFSPYYHADDSFTRFLASNGHAFRRQKNQVDQIHSAAAALPVSGQAAPSGMQDHRRAQPPQLELGQTTRPQVAFVDLVDSDDEGGGGVQELDLELKL